MKTERNIENEKEERVERKILMKYDYIVWTVNFISLFEGVLQCKQELRTEQQHQQQKH